MLLNLSNHPSAYWNEAQRRAALEEFGRVEDLPFPPIPPEWTTAQAARMAEEYGKRCRARLIESPDGNSAVHVMGELTFTFALVVRLQRVGIRCVASTSAREVTLEPDGSQRAVFRFVRFRDYPALSSP